MSDRVCGNCKHFQPAGFLGHGWCMHPYALQAFPNERVLVRRKEKRLRCEQPSGLDLYERTEASAELNERLEAIVASVATERIVIPEQQDILISETTVWRDL